MKRILITGANSYIGTSFEKYISENHPDDYLVDTVDMIDGGWREKSFAGYDSVFHVAGIAHSDSGRIKKLKEQIYYDINVKLAIEAAQKAKADGVSQFIFMSSSIVYGNSAPIGKTKTITKDTPVSPANCYGSSKVQAEEGIQPLNDEHFKIVVLRPPLVYGKGCKGNYALLSKLALKTPLFPFVRNERSMLYVENLCEFVCLMVENEERGIFWPQNKEYSNTSDIVKSIAKAHGKKVCLIKGFVWLLKLLGCVTGLINKAFGSLSYDKSMSEYRVGYHKYSLEQSIIKTELGK